ncbi:MAG: DUF4160 domain-containing protein [Planctomycetes bacterium]|nr:DUF4160 domain-containing protein [Planctomycetota bacterium]
MSKSISESDALALLARVNCAQTEDMTKTAGRVATVDSVAVSIYPLEPTQHKAPHFHARFNEEEEAVYAIESGEVLAGQLKRSRNQAVLEWRSTRVEQLLEAWQMAQRGEQPIKIAASLGNESGQPSPAIATLSGVAQIVMMEIDGFMRGIGQIAQNQNLGSSTQIDGACKCIGEQVFDLMARICDMARSRASLNEGLPS